jgi:hypothetical protein
LEKIDLEGIYVNSTLLEREIDYLEQQLLVLNKTYWRELNALVQDQLNAIPSIAASQLTELCEFSLQHIHNYINQSGATLKR